MVPIVELYTVLDDFCKFFEQNMTARLLPRENRQRKRLCSLSLSEIMTIVVMFHFSGYYTFKDFYVHCLSVHYKSFFPRLVRYTRFVELQFLAAMPLFLFLTGISKQHTGRYFVDSTKIEVCDMLRMSTHKMFKNSARIGKTSTGWFFGFKLHLIINNKGELMNFRMTPGNADDRSVLAKMTKGLRGWLFGDKGYISKKRFEELKNQGLELITRQKKNSKKQYLDPIKKRWLDKRGVIEATIGQLKEMMRIQHTRHRSYHNFVVHIFATLVAYVLKPKKPTVSFGKSIAGATFLISN